MSASTSLDPTNGKTATTTTDMSNAGSGVSAGFILPRLNPREIALLLLPGTTVTVMDASDAQFQSFVATSGLKVNENGIAGWSFDDRIRTINHARKYGLDLFGLANKNNSDGEQKQFGNNSPSELFDVPEAALQAGALSLEDSAYNDKESVRMDAQKSSETEQKAFGEGNICAGS